MDPTRRLVGGGGDVFLWFKGLGLGAASLSSRSSSCIFELSTTLIGSWWDDMLELVVVVQCESNDL